MLVIHPETIAHLINYDTTHGKYNLKVEPIEKWIASWRS